MKLALDQFVEYLRLQKSGGLSEGTIERYLLNLRHLQAESGKHLFGIKTYAEISTCLRQLRLKRNWSTSTTKNAADSFSVFYTWAVRHGYMAAVDHPMSLGHEFKNTERRQMDFFDWGSDNFKKLLYNPQNSVRDSAIMHTLRSSGVRASELCNLTFDDIDLGSRWLFIRQGKGKKDGYAPIDDEAKQWLSIYIPQVKLHSKEPWVFQNEDFKKMRPETLHKIIARKADRLGFKANPQMFRRSLGGEMIQRGADISIVQQVLRHASVQTTANHYVRFKKEKLKDQYDQYLPKMASV